MANYNVIPFYVKSLFLPKDDNQNAYQIKKPTADFTQLPYYDEEGISKNDKNSFLGGTATPKFQERQALKRGVHLHFILPEALTQPLPIIGMHPPVPNRWLVVRKRDSKKWVIFNDYLSTTENNSRPISNVFIPINQKEKINKDNWEQSVVFQKKDGNTTYKTKQAFRYVGQVENFKENLSGNIDKNENRWDFYFDEPLTALAHGSPHFSSFYPDCKSVFGFYDEEGKAGDEYTVYGWWEDINSPAWDILAWTHFNQYLYENPPFEGYQRSNLNWANIDDFVASHAGSNINGDGEKYFPHILKFDTSYFKEIARKQPTIFGNLPLQPLDFKTLENQTAAYTVTVANTTSEAIAAFVAQKIADGTEYEFDINSEIIALLSKLTTLHQAFQIEVNESLIEQYNLLVGRNSKEKLIRIIKTWIRAENLKGTHAERLNIIITRIEGLSTDEKKALTKVLIEDLLQSFQLGFWEREQLDISAKFEEARHAAGFIREAGKTLYDISFGFSKKTAPKNGTTAQQVYHLIKEDSTLSAALQELSGAIGQLNAIKNNLEDNVEAIKTKRQDLFTVWNKYLYRKVNSITTTGNGENVHFNVVNSDSLMNIMLYDMVKLLKLEKSTYVFWDRFQQIESYYEKNYNKPFLNILAKRFEEIHGYPSVYHLKAQAKTTLNKFGTALEKLKELLSSQNIKLDAIASKNANSLYNNLLITVRDFDDTLPIPSLLSRNIIADTNKNSIITKGVNEVQQIINLLNQNNSVLETNDADDAFFNQLNEHCQEYRKQYQKILNYPLPEKAMVDLPRQIKDLELGVQNIGRERVQKAALDLYQKLTALNYADAPQNVRLNQALSRLKNYVLSTKNEIESPTKAQPIENILARLQSLEEYLFDVERRLTQESPDAFKKAFELCQQDLKAIGRSLTTYFAVKRNLSQLDREHITPAQQITGLVEEVASQLEVLRHYKKAYTEFSSFTSLQKNIHEKISVLSEFRTRFDIALRTWLLQSHLRPIHSKVKATFLKALLKIDLPNAANNSGYDDFVTALHNWYAKYLGKTNYSITKIADIKPIDEFYKILNNSDLKDETACIAAISQWYRGAPTISGKDTLGTRQVFLATVKTFIEIPASLLEQEIQAQIEVEQLLDNLNQVIADTSIITLDNKIEFSLEEKLGPRYYKPTNPVVLIEQPIDNQHYQPMLLHWDMLLHPISPSAGVGVKSPDYEKVCVDKYFKAPSEQPDFTLHRAISEAGTKNSYVGLMMLTNPSKELFQESIDQILADNAEAASIEESTLQLLQTTKDILDKSHFYAQALNGFDEAFLSLYPTVQIPLYHLKDNFNYSEKNQYINFFSGTDSVQTPETDFSFNPLRAGGLKVNELHFYDSFGIRKCLKSDDINLQQPDQIISASTINSEKHHALLSPRFIQPLRIHARWTTSYISNAVFKKATQDNRIIESNGIHHSSPICGWVLPNNLNQSLMIYDADGTELGNLLEKKGEVVFMAGYKKLYTHVEQIQNKFLQDFVKYILNDSQPLQLLKGFIKVLNESLQYIDPDSYSLHPEMAIFSSRPVALIRLKLNFEANGDFPMSHRYEDSWFNLTQYELIRNTRKVENIEVPIRLGDYQQLNDGLIGYWRHKDKTYYDANVSIGTDEFFYAPIAKEYAAQTQHSKIITIANADKHDNIQIKQSLKEESLYVNMLFDPRAKLNITTGVLPVKTIDIPLKLYQEALRRLELTFLNAPIITPRSKIRLPIMEDNSLVWQWIQYEADKDSDKKYIEKEWFGQALQARLGNNVDINSNWNSLIREGILGEITINNNTKYFYQEGISWSNIPNKEALQLILDNYAGKKIKTITQDVVLTKKDMTRGIKALALDEEFSNTQIVWDKLIDHSWLQQLEEYYVSPAAERDNPLPIATWSAPQQKVIKEILDRYVPNILGTQLTKIELTKDLEVREEAALANKIDQLWMDLLTANWILVSKEKAKINNRQEDLIDAADSRWVDEQESLKWILNTYGVGIEPELQHAEYQLQEIREGWLKLTTPQ